ncbi:MAG TPA: flagellar basal-body MS-ring/collar protein FliF, partial [candidate division Zixibacteria bacterium]
MPSGKKFTFVFTTIVVVAGLVLLVSWVRNVSYVPLYSGLDASEAGVVVDKLIEGKVPYRLSNRGTTILVASSRVYDIRIKLAAEGLPRTGTIGYEIFDKSNLGMTDFLQKVNYRRALEGELTKTICQLREVQAARVHIVIPERRLFEKDKIEATASVALKLSPAHPLGKSQIQGIAYLVASSVEGLKPGNITIVDYEGNLLSSNNDGNSLASLSGSQMELRQNVESYLETKAQSLLDGVIGQGKSIVRVTAELNFEQAEKTLEEYDPEKLTIRSEERSTEGEKENVITNYEVNRTVEHIIGEVGNIKRLSVAVMVDGNYTTTTNEQTGATEKKYIPRTQEELDRLASIVKSAVGFDDTRTDKLEIASVAFDRTKMEDEQKELDKIEKRNNYFSIGEKVTIVIGVLLGLLVLHRIIKKASKSISEIAASAQPPLFKASGKMGVGEKSF